LSGQINYTVRLHLHTRSFCISRTAEPERSWNFSC